VHGLLAVPPGLPKAHALQTLSLSPLAARQASVI